MTGSRPQGGAVWGSWPDEAGCLLDTMLIDLNKLQGSRERVERVFEPSAFDPQDSEYRVAAPVRVSLDIQKLGSDAFAVVGSAVTRLEVTCSRCLEPFEVPVDTAFDLRYVPQTHNTGEGEHEVAEEDLVTAYHREGLLDLIDLLREQFVLALPMKPLCSEACRGLCPHCGTNLNKSQCDCAPRWEDPRLAALKSLLTRDKEN
jgi:uncharacterized protein